MKRAEMPFILAALEIEYSANAQQLGLGSSVSDGVVVGHMTIESSKIIGQFKPYLSYGLSNCVELN